jgi:osmotically-inducible protein OsmY
MSNDSHLQEAVLAELRWEPGVEAGHIGVSAHGGVVILTGHVGTLTEKHVAEAAACRVKGVKAVADEIEVRLNPDMEHSDEEIAAAAVARLAWNASVPRNAVKVAVERGMVTLTGEVDWHFQKAAAAEDMHRLLGVTGVKNDVAIKPKVQSSSLSDDIMHAMHRSWFFDPNTVKVSMEDGTVRLTGTVLTLHDRQVAAATAWSAPGVIDVVNELTIA